MADVEFEIVEAGDAPVVRATIPAGGSLYADAGAMMSMTPNLRIESSMRGGVMGALSRSLLRGVGHQKGGNGVALRFGSLELAGRALAEIARTLTASFVVQEFGVEQAALTLGAVSLLRARTEASARVAPRTPRLRVVAAPEQREREQ